MQTGAFCSPDDFYFIQATHEEAELCKIRYQKIHAVLVDLLIREPFSGWHPSNIYPFFFSHQPSPPFSCVVCCPFCVQMLWKKEKHPITKSKSFTCLAGCKIQGNLNGHQPRSTLGRVKASMGFVSLVGFFFVFCFFLNTSVSGLAVLYLFSQADRSDSPLILPNDLSFVYRDHLQKASSEINSANPCKESHPLKTTLCLVCLFAHVCYFISDFTNPTLPQTTESSLRRFPRERKSNQEIKSMKMDVLSN